MTRPVYKVLALDGSSLHGGSGKWPLPTDKPGDWIEVKGPLVPCKNGLHLCRVSDLACWLGPAIYKAEIADDAQIIEHGSAANRDGKLVTNKARLLRRIDAWDERTARLYACDCADRALSRLTDPDPLAVEAIRVARAFANNAASAEQLSAAYFAAHSAACSAAYFAAHSAACSAAHSAAHSAACSAACSAAYFAAHSAACSAAYSAEAQWQAERLIQYLNGTICQGRKEKANGR